MTATLPGGTAGVTTPTVLDPAVALRLAAQVTAGPSAPTIECRSPFDGALVGRLPVSSEADVDVAFGSARAAQRAWADRPVAARGRVLLTLPRPGAGPPGRGARPRAVGDRQGPPGRARGGPRRRDQRALLRAQRRPAARPAAPPRGAPAAHPGDRQQHHHAKGVVGVISPWNYPLTLAVSDAHPRALAGNARRAQARHPDHVHRAVGAATCCAEAGLPEGAVPGRHRCRPGGRPGGRSTGPTTSVHRLDAGRPRGGRAAAASG